MLVGRYQLSGGRDPQAQKFEGHPGRNDHVAEHDPVRSPKTPKKSSATIELPTTFAAAWPRLGAHTLPVFTLSHPDAIKSSTVLTGNTKSPGSRSP